jgi:hypothetical protein
MTISIGRKATTIRNLFNLFIGKKRQLGELFWGGCVQVKGVLLEITQQFTYLFPLGQLHFIMVIQLVIITLPVLCGKELTGEKD